MAAVGMGPTAALLNVWHPLYLNVNPVVVQLKSSSRVICHAV
jgi:hypothetical protein